MSVEMICDRCGEELPRIEVTTWADLPDRRYVFGMCDCPPAPKPCCTFCCFPVDLDGRCGSLDCFFVGQVVINPVMLRYAS